MHTLVQIKSIICWHQSEILYDIYQQDFRSTLFVTGYSGHTLLKYDACSEAVLHITPNVKWVHFDSCVQTAGITSSWSGGILGKLIVVSLVRKFLASYAVRRFITMLTGARCRSCTSPVESSLCLHAIFVFFWSILLLLCHLCTGLSGRIFPSDFATQHF